MRRMASAAPVFSLLLALLATGCEPVERSTPGRAPDTHDTAVTAAADPSNGAALPGLLAIMAGLEQDLAVVSRGLWQENLDTVAAGAAAVAGHPTVPPAEAQRIAEVLGSEMAGFKAQDTHVHDLAVEMEERARAGDLLGVLAADAELRAGCVACHTSYRDRLRAAIR